MGEAVRLQRFLASAGVAARRKAEEMITAGRVIVNGKVVTVLGTKIEPDNDSVQVDGGAGRGRQRTGGVLHKTEGRVTGGAGRQRLVVDAGCIRGEGGAGAILPGGCQCRRAGGARSDTRATWLILRRGSEVPSAVHRTVPTRICTTPCGCNVSVMPRPHGREVDSPSKWCPPKSSGDQSGDRCADFESTRPTELSVGVQASVGSGVVRAGCFGGQAVVGARHQREHVVQVAPAVSSW